MAVSKRVRFEVLRRDKYTCRYCRATDTELTIDHVTPVALGGNDHPDNLVAACRDCNAGKSSTNPDAPTLEPLTDAAIAYEKARAKVVRRKARESKKRHDEQQKVLWRWESNFGHYPTMSEDWRKSVNTWLGRGLTVERICEAIDITAGRDLPAARAYSYMAKICWNWITELETEIKAELKSPEKLEKPFDPARIIDLFIDKRTDLLPSNVKVYAKVA